MSKEASVKVKRWEMDLEPWSYGEMRDYENGEYVLASDYDALLALARRLRASVDVLVRIDKRGLYSNVLNDSAWLEE